MEKVTAVCPVEDFILEVTFSDGQIRRFDMRPYLDRGAFTRLTDPVLFAQAYVDFDTVCWPENLDIAPETLYLRSIPISPVERNHHA